MPSTQNQLLRYADAFATPARLPSDPDLVAAYLAEFMSAERTSLGIAEVDAVGHSLATDQSGAPEMDVADRPYFEVLRNGDESVHVDRISFRPSGTDALVIWRRRPGSTLSGIAVAAIETHALGAFLARLAPATGRRRRSSAGMASCCCVTTSINRRSRSSRRRRSCG